MHGNISFITSEHASTMNVMIIRTKFSGNRQPNVPNIRNQFARISATLQFFTPLKINCEFRVLKNILSTVDENNKCIPPSHFQPFD